MSNTLVSQQLTQLILPEDQLSHRHSIMSQADCSKPNMEGSMESFSSNPTTEPLPVSSMQHHSMDYYHTLSTPVGQDMSLSYNLNGQFKSMPDNMDLQQFAMPNKESGQAQAMHSNSGQPTFLVPTKRKAITELTPDNSGPQKTSTPNKRVAQVGSVAKSSNGLQVAPNKKPMPNSSRSSGSGRKVVHVEPVMNKPQSTMSKKSAQPQVSSKQQKESDEPVRAKLRESLASALALVSQPRESSSDGKLKKENASTSNVPCPADSCNDVKIATEGIHSNAMSIEVNQTWNFIGQEFQSNSLLSGEISSFNNGFFPNDELLQGNGLSWASDFNPLIPEVKVMELATKPELMREGVISHEKEEAFRSPEYVACEIESELFKLFGGVNKKYKEKGRSLLFNLKDPNNPELRERVMSGDIPPERLCSMTAEELASKELSEWRIAKAEELDQMKVLPNSEVNMRRLVKKTHKGEYQVDFDPDIGASEEISFSGNVTLQNRSKINGSDSTTPSKVEKTKVDQDNECEITVPCDSTDMQGLMVDDVRDLPPIVSLDEFMESLDKEPPFENLPVDSGMKTPESDKENSEAGSKSRSPVQPSKHPVKVSPKKTEEMGVDRSRSPVQPLKRPVAVSPKKTEEVDVESIKPDGYLKSTDQRGLGTNTVVHFPKGERVWEGLVQINISDMANFVALYKSGEKASTREWPGFFEIKGRVRLEPFDKFLQALPTSRTRAIMVSHFVLKEGSTDSERASLVEVVDSYITDQRVGFAEPAPGVELYLCPPRTGIVDMIIKHLPKSYTEKLNDIDSGLVGIVVWRKIQITPSVISPDSSRDNNKDMTKKHYFPPPILSKPQADHDEDEDDDVPPGFGPPGGPRDDDDLPEFNFSGSSNRPLSSHSDPNPYPGSGQRTGSHHLHPRVEEMRELVQKYGQNGINNGSGIPIQIQPWNDDDDDDIPEWQPKAPHQELQPPPLQPARNHAFSPCMANQLQFQQPPRPPLAQPLQPLQPPMNVHRQGIWRPHDPNIIGNRPSGQFYGGYGHSGRDWRPNSSNKRRF